MTGFVWPMFVHSAPGSRSGNGAGATTTAIVCVLLMALLSAATSAEARHVLAVDLGTDWAKAATLGGSSGAPVRADIVLNDQTNRKSPQCIAFRFLPYKGKDKLQSVERFFAEQAQALEPRFPKEVVCSPSLLVGYNMLHDTVQPRGVVAVTEGEEAVDGEEDERSLLFSEDVLAFPFSVVPHLPRGSVVLRIARRGNNGKEDEVEFSAEELLGMFLGYLKSKAEHSLGGEPLQYLGVTVPTAAPLAYRQAIVDSAAIAGLRTVRVVHSTTAAAVQLAYLNVEQFFKTTQESEVRYVMLYNMGSRSTEAAIFRFSTQKQQKVISLVSAVVNSTLGGRAFDLCIARYAERELFPHAKPTPIEPVLGKPTAAARNAAASLLRAANVAREQMSVNHKVPFVVQGIRGDRGGDFTGTVSRTVFELECTDLFDEAVRLRDIAIAQTNGAVRSVQDLTRFEVIGGATRMPKLVERLSEGYSKVVERTLNGDEAIVLGAAHMSAAKAGIGIPGFHVVEPLTNNVYFTVSPPIDAVGEGVVTDNQPQGSQWLHLLFAKGSTLVPAERSLRFQNRTVDFTLILQDKSGRFKRSVAISGVKASIEVAQQVAHRASTPDGDRRTKELTSLESTEVVVDVVLTESGIPVVSSAYLRAMYLKEERLQQLKEKGDDKSVVAVGEREADDVANNTQEKLTTANSTASAGAAATDASEQSAGEDHTPGTMDEANRQHAENGGKPDVPQWGEKEEEAPEGSVTDEEGANTAAGGGGGGAEAQPEVNVSRPMLNDSVNVTRFMRRWKLRFSLASEPEATGLNINKAESVASRDRLRALQRMENERLLRSALRNDIEALVLHYKSTEAWADPTNSAAGWRDVVMDVARWFDEADDDVEVSALQEQQKRLKELRIS